jgi:two-component system chemotaxis sensor kinase CheA
VGGKEFLKYQDSSLRLVRLHDHMPVAAPLHDPEDVFIIIPKLVKHPMGIVAHDCHDVITTRVEVERDNLKGPGVLGSAVLEGMMTLFLDIYSLFEAVDPETYRQDQARTGSIQGARVLLAEDTSFFRAVEKKYLESLGAVVTSTMDGKEAWAALGHPDAAFDLVVTDLEMPQMGGLELTRHIRSSARWRDIPVVALTSLGSADDREAGIEAGVTAYETKLDKDRLAATLRQVMEGVCAHA